MSEAVIRQVSSWTPVGQDVRLPCSSAEVSRLLFFSTKVRWACPGLFLSKPWLLRFGSQECDSKLTADDIILSANPFPAKDLFGDTKTQRITICHGLHRRPLAPKSFLYHVDRPSAHDKKVANSLPGLLKSPQVFCWLWKASGNCLPLCSSLRSHNSCGDSPGLVPAPFLAAGGNLRATLPKSLQIVNPLRLSS